MPENTQFWQDNDWIKIECAKHFIKYAVGAYKINELHIGDKIHFEIHRVVPMKKYLLNIKNMF